MDASSLIAEYRRWLVFQRQEQLSQEHRGASERMAKAGVTSNRVVEAYRSMADKGSREGACYRALFLRQRGSDDVLPCEGWLFVRRVLAEGGMTRVRAHLLETFTLEDGIIEPGDKPATKITLEIYDELKVERSMSTVSRVDRIDARGDTHFITLLDAVRGDLRKYMT